MTNKIFQVNYQNSRAATGTCNWNNGSNDWTAGDPHRSGVSSDQTTNTNGKNGVSSYWTSSTSHWNNVSNDRTVYKGHHNSGSSHQIADTSYPAHQTGYLGTKWGEGKPLCVLVKCFTKFLMVNRFTTFHKRFYNKKYIYIYIYYKFNYILHANKHLKWESIFQKIFYFKINKGLNYEDSFFFSSLSSANSHWLITPL